LQVLANVLHDLVSDVESEPEEIACRKS